MDGVDKMPNGIIMDSAIQFCLSNELLRETVRENTTKGICDMLESLYIAKSVTNRFFLKSRLYDLRLEEGNSRKSLLDEFHTIFMELPNIDVVVDDEDLAISCYVLYYPLIRFFVRYCYMVGSFLLMMM